jgi:hypothetical protein
MTDAIMTVSCIHKLTATERLILIVILTLIEDGKGSSEVSLQKLVEMTRLSERSISRALNTFRNREILSIKSGVSPLNRSGKITPNTYKLA